MRYGRTLFAIVGVALVVRIFVLPSYRISTENMTPTLLPGDLVFAVGKIGLGDLESPARGEVVVFRCPENPDEPCVKRVVGVAGDRIEVRAGRLLVNDQLAREAPGQLATPRPAEIVPPNHVFLVGDNLAADDSKRWEPIPSHSILGRVFLIWLSFGSDKVPGSDFKLRSDRVFRFVH